MSGGNQITQAAVKISMSNPEISERGFPCDNVYRALKQKLISKEKACDFNWIPAPLWCHAVSNRLLITCTQQI